MMPPMLSQIRQNGLPSWAYKAALLLAAAIWGMGTVVIKSTVDEFPPAWIVGVRFTLAGIILGIATAPRISRAFARNKRGHLRDGAVLGVFLFLSYWFNSTGLTDTTASNSSFLTTLYCVIIPFLGWIIIRKRPTRYNIAAAILCVTGVGCVAYAGIGEFSLRFGDFITLASALWLSFHVLYTAKYAPGRSMMLLTVIQFIVAGLLGLITGLITEPMPDFSQLGADTWMSLIYITVFASCVALGLQNAAVARVDPAQAALFLATESVFGVTFSILLLGEAPAISAYLGFALIFVGIVVSEYLPLRAEKIAAQKARATAEAAALDCSRNPGNRPRRGRCVHALAIPGHPSSRCRFSLGRCRWPQSCLEGSDSSKSRSPCPRRWSSAGTGRARCGRRRTRTGAPRPPRLPAGRPPGVR